MGDDEGPHLRRKRYRGSHPRAFEEKYKERRPEDYREDVERVLARGDTPAGSHRPICVKEILEVLAPRPGETAVDATLGYGGHARAILGAILPGGRLYGFDLDSTELPKTARRLMAVSEGAFTPVHANFARLPEVLADAGLGGVDLFLADLGLSSMQLDDPARGFSFKRRGPLDMRMDPGRGLSAREYLSGAAEGKLCEILMANADAGEDEAERIAGALCRRRGRLATTRDLAEAVCSAFPSLEYKDPTMSSILQRAFQAIRIEVNGEFPALEALLARLPSCLNPGGRAAFLAFHSGEDRRVEAALEAGLAEGLYSSVATEAIRPGREERYGNPRSSSAKLRWAIHA
jgi:16S rRNA (cytosine1402-N4)-methyltransferase